MKSTDFASANTGLKVLSPPSRGFGALCKILRGESDRIWIPPPRLEFVPIRMGHHFSNRIRRMLAAKEGIALSGASTPETTELYHSAAHRRLTNSVWLDIERFAACFACAHFTASKFLLGRFCHLGANSRVFCLTARNSPQMWSTSYRAINLIGAILSEFQIAFRASLHQGYFTHFCGRNQCVVAI